MRCKDPVTIFHLYGYGVTFDNKGISILFHPIVLHKTFLQTEVLVNIISYFCDTKFYLI